MGFMNLILSVLAVYAVAGAAAPVDGASGSVLAARAETSIDMCDNSRFNGDCKKLTVTTGSCYNVPDSMAGRISAIRNNNKDKTSCTWYRASNCRGETYTNQDDGNLGDGNGHFNDSIRSLECKRK
ncbi:hypothetical protein CH063_10302 [Colletotrichum higginsianum]|uniref:Uncharacterized protein n=2 Tax=Colletotrichum higginsianum TaxID=80884 RepID=H1VGX4_COLHI|nr:hypothetical protein CH63R_12478 [Colletotrichum higginsianum IMI 349063]OBR03351.1 hypothetical protein CH63R_12478 [Colletotrichum higginsianum IMI 349063]TIC89905.1 hypothetical protein CH35J_012436 [Colletotrichum higginsianum]CCF39477.1 hypothetical protein CH063_10302 [Colletotrichum higginsianum]